MCRSWYESGERRSWPVGKRRQPGGIGLRQTPPGPGAHGTARLLLYLCQQFLERSCSGGVAGQISKYKFGLFSINYFRKKNENDSFVSPFHSTRHASGVAHRSVASALARCAACARRISACRYQRPPGPPCPAPLASQEDRPRSAGQPRHRHAAHHAPAAPAAPWQGRARRRQP